jgi:GNAT superfamily N-acetyltransferase
MLTIEKIDTNSKAHVRRFTRLPFQYYTETPQWVPPIMIDHESQLDRQKHPFYEHSDGDFFIAVRDGKDVARLAVLENRRFNDYHGVRKAQFYFFECDDDLETASALFNRAFEWAHERKLDTVVGPKGLGPLDGYGMLVEGFEFRQLMTMMNYNQAYLPKLVEALGFTKEVDFVSCYLGSSVFGLPERVHHIANRVLERGTIKVLRFKTKGELVSWAPRIGQAYNNAMIKNWEYYPLTEREISYVVDNILSIANPKLFKILAAGDQAIGYLFAFPDISAAIQRNRGRLLPFGIPDIMIEMKRTKWVALNGMGILPEYQGRGGNALLYSEMEKTIKEFNFLHADLTQIAETATQMRSDLENLGGKPYKNHRVYTRSI